jgi:hypothetical protein
MGREAGEHHASRTAFNPAGNDRTRFLTVSTLSGDLRRRLTDTVLARDCT